MDKFKKQVRGAWNSFTIWWNASWLLLLTLATNEPLLLEYLTEHGLVLVIITGNVILRFKTNQGLENKTNVQSV